MKAVLVSLAVVVGSLGAAAQEGADAKHQPLLQKLFPEAKEFSPRGGNPPHFRAFTKPPGSPQPAVTGYAFWTTELAPLERGYDGPIKILVGMNPQGILTGIVVVEHREPYGYFSVDTPEFVAQFKGKSVRDAFAVGRDIDAVSRATITVRSASRAVKLSAQRIARALLTPPTR